MKIEIITTPNEALKETGFGNLSSCKNILSSVLKMDHDTRISSCSSLSDLERVRNRQPDLVLLAVKYIPVVNGDDIWLSKYFENYSIPYSGSSKKTLNFDSDKILAKLHLREKGIATARFFTASEGEYQRNQPLPLNYPLFLKPNGAANGNGIDEQSFVSSFEEFDRKVSSLQRLYQQPTLVEDYLNGKEFTVAIMNTKDGELLVSPVEIVVPKTNSGHRILSESIKAKNTETLKKVTDREAKSKINRLAFEVFIGLGIEGFARIDIKSNTKGEYFFMEVNLVPGMTFGSSYFPEAFRIDRGISYDQTISSMVDYCLDKEEDKTLGVYSFMTSPPEQRQPH